MCVSNLRRRHEGGESAYTDVDDLHGDCLLWGSVGRDV
jgi:hypothetical protein